MATNITKEAVQLLTGMEEKKTDLLAKGGFSPEQLELIRQMFAGTETVLQKAEKTVSLVQAETKAKIVLEHLTADEKLQLWEGLDSSTELNAEYAAAKAAYDAKKAELDVIKAELDAAQEAKDNSKASQILIPIADRYLGVIERAKFAWTVTGTPVIDGDNKVIKDLEIVARKVGAPKAAPKPHVEGETASRPGYKYTVVYDDVSFTGSPAEIMAHPVLGSLPWSLSYKPITGNGTKNTAMGDTFRNFAKDTWLDKGKTGPRTMSKEDKTWTVELVTK